MSKKIVIDIKSDGSLKAETFNMNGAKCLDELDKLLKSLSNELSTTKKDDYFKEATIASETNIHVKNK